MGNYLFGSQPKEIKNDEKIIIEGKGNAGGGGGRASKYLEKKPVELACSVSAMANKGVANVSSEDIVFESKGAKT